jgi:hypothetical protein
MAIETVTAILYKDGKPKDGLSASVWCIRLSDRKYLDWGDGVFKSSGWTSISTPMTNLSDGIYYKDVDVAGWNNEEFLFIVSGSTADNIPQYGTLNLRVTYDDDIRGGNSV